MSLLASHAAALAALAVTLAGSLLLGRRPAWLPAAAALALALGWFWLAGFASRGLWTPHRIPDLLLAPALASALVAAAVASGRHRRLLLVADAVFAGWWIARAGVGTADFWRAWLAVALLAWAVGRIVAGEAARGLALALALWGGLSITGAGSAALVAAAAWVGLCVAGKGAVVPAAAMAALIGAADIAGGRLLRGRLDATDLACLFALAAPAIADALLRRTGRAGNRFFAVMASVLAAAILTGLVWIVARAAFGGAS